MHPIRYPHDISGTGMSRRVFLKVATAAGAGLTLAVYGGRAAAQAAAGASVDPSAFVRIGTDDTVTVIVKHLEMGQGTYTGLPALVAEELGATWAQIRAEGAPANAAIYNNLLWGPAQGTGGSTALANSWLQYRTAGATARAMLVAAAAMQWKVDAATISVKDGVVSATGKRATFGQLASAAAQQPVPASVKLKDAADFVFIGKHFPRTDSKAKSNGTAIYTQDIKLPGMLTAVVAHSPRFGGRVKRFDSDGVVTVPGVRYVIEVPNGVAVVGTSFWAAKKGRDALRVEWDDSIAFKASSSEVFDEFRRLSKTPGKQVRNDGDVARALAGGAKRIDAEFVFPYLAHAPMEPLNCVVKLSADRCEIWNGEQFHTADQHAVAAVVGLKPEQVFINQLFAGGSFGRRASSTSDYVVEAAAIAKGIAKAGKRDIPVKLVWTREDDMTGGYYRPAYLHTMSAALDASGNVAAWQHRIVGQSITEGTPIAAMTIKNGIDATSVEGASNLPYSIANLGVDLHSPSIGIPVLWWRSVGSTHTAYATEVMIDELAVAAGKDPVAFRLALLGSAPRHRGVLELAAQKAGWGTPLAPGKPGEKRGRGVAVHQSFNTYVAEVAEVTIDARNQLRVDRVVCAVDCGVAVNPDVVRAQMEGGIGFALAAALYGEITLTKGVVQQTNFHQYPVLRINEMPTIDVHIVQSGDKPTGVGEPGVPPLAPAVANAIAAATGKRLRSLPFNLA
ncbi:MAG: xanthine dehydrogenase family protein molybdopterin-binding subunit [Casimicrobiaceae bacterium]